MKNEFIQAINQVCAERNLSKDVVFAAVEDALISAYKRNFGGVQTISVKIDQHTGQVQLYLVKEAAESVSDPSVQVTLESARQIRPDAQIGETVMEECAPPKDFGRIAAQTAKQVILQRIREAERDTLYHSFMERVGEMINATVQTVESNMVTVNLGKAEGLMPRGDWIPGERYRPLARIRVCITEVGRGTRGPEIIVSRGHRDLLRRLLEMEVPEILSGAVEVKGIAREAGSRSKVAVVAKQPRLDPVGACVGQRGYRIQNIVNELNGEKIDIVAWNPDMATFVSNALSPAKPMDVLLDDRSVSGKTATVIVPDKQLSLAIGKEGQNVRLAAKLTGWRIDIKSMSEREEEARLQKERVAAGPEEDILVKAEAILMGKEQAEVAPVEEAAEAPVAAEPLPEPKAEAESAVATEAVAAEVEPQPAPAVETPEPVAEGTVEAVAPAPEEVAAGEAAVPAAPVDAGALKLDLGEVEEEEGTGKAAKKKTKKGKAGAPKAEDWRKPKKPSRRRDWGEDTGDEEY